MNAELLGTAAHNTPEWYALREGMIGGSDIASVMGLSEWKSGFTLWHEMKGLVEPAERTPDMQRKMAFGHHMEPFVADLFEEAHPSWLPRATGTWRNKERPWQGCNPDRLIVIDGNVSTLLEIKTDTTNSDWDTPPEKYLAQVKWQIDTFGFDGGYLGAYFPLSGRYREWEIEADPFEAEAMRLRAKQFFDSLDSDEPPAIDGLKSTYETLRKLNPSIRRGAEIHIPQDVAEAYLAATQGYKAAETELTKWKGHLLAHIGTAQYGVYLDKKIASRVAVKDGVPYLKEA